MNIPHAKRGTWYVQATYIAMTITRPTPGMTRSTIEFAIRKYLTPGAVIQLLVSREEHINGEPHFHIYLELNRKRYVSVAMMKTALQRTHKDEDTSETYVYLSTIQRIENYLEYMLKFDEDANINGNYWNSYEEVGHYIADRGRIKLTDQISSFLQAGNTVAEAAEKWPGYAMNHFNSLSIFKGAMDNEKKNKKEIAERIPIPGPWIDWHNYSEKQDRIIAEWLLFHEKKPGLNKKVHLYVWGEKNTGKSEFWKTLKKYKRVYQFQPDTSNLWHDQFDPKQDYDFIIWDEFDQNRWIDLNWTNFYLDGFVKVSRRNNAPLIRNKIIPMIILSNKSPDTVWSGYDPEQIRAFMARFTIIHTTSRNKLNVLRQGREIGLEDFNVPDFADLDADELEPIAYFNY